jgi:hypothetical protein
MAACTAIFAHLLLNPFWQQFHQRWPPRYPRHAAIKPPRRLCQALSELLLHLGEQPAHLQHGFVFLRRLLCRLLT